MFWSLFSIWPILIGVAGFCLYLITKIIIHYRKPNFKVGGIYLDCGYHPVRCTLVDEDNDIIEGISLLDGSSPRSCSIHLCNITKVNRA